MNHEADDSEHYNSVFLQAILEFETAIDSASDTGEVRILERYPSCAPRLKEYFDNRRKANVVLEADGGARKRPSIVDLKSFGDYTVGQLISWGGNASIHSVSDVRFGRTAAIKVPLKHLVDDGQVFQRLIREAKFNGRLQHPGIVPVYDVGITKSDAGDVPYFTMRLIQGSSFGKLLKERADSKHELSRFIYVFRQICYAVGHAHKQGIIHCDLKSDNVMVGEFDDPYVMDWGFAKEIATDSSERVAKLDPVSIVGCFQQVSDASLTVTMPKDVHSKESTNAILGTPCYLPPEIAKFGINAAGKSSDVFCLGGMLSLILTGSPTFIGTPIETFYASYNQDLTDVHSRLSACGADPQLIQLAKSCLSIAPADRPQDAYAVAVQVSNYLLSQEEAQLAAERLARVSAESTAKAEAKLRQRTVLLGILVLTAIVIVAATGIYFINREYNQDIASRQATQDREKATTIHDVRDAIAQTIELINRAELVRAEGQIAFARNRAGKAVPDFVIQEIVNAELMFDVAKRLDAIRDEALVLNYDPMAAPVIVNDKYEHEFKRLSIEPLKNAADAARLLSGSPIRQTLISALDVWTTFETREAQMPPLLATARLADPDPNWGDRFRDEEIRASRKKLVALAQQSSLESLSLDQLHALALAMPYTKEENKAAFRVLRHIEQSYPSDYFVHAALTNHIAAMCKDSLSRDSQESKLNALSYARTACALRPDSLGALLMRANLALECDTRDDLEYVLARLSQVSDGQWLKHLIQAKFDSSCGRHASALQHLRQVKQLQPSYDVAMLEITCLQHLGKSEEARMLVDGLPDSQPDRSFAELTMLYNYSDNEQFPEAIALVKSLAKTIPKDDIAEYSDFLEAVAHLHQSSGRLVELKQFATRRSRGDLAKLWQFYLDLHTGQPESAFATWNSLTLPGDPSMEAMEPMVLSYAGKFSEAKIAWNAWRNKNAKENRQLGLGLFGDFGVAMNDRELNVFLNLEDKFPDNGPVPTWSELNKVKIAQWKALDYGDFFFAKKAYVLATQAYMHALPPGASINRYNGMGRGVANYRIRAAMAATLASGGSGKDALRANDVECRNFRIAALRWLEEEVADCKRIGTTPTNLFTAVFNNGNAVNANMSLAIILLHESLQTIRDDNYMGVQPEEHRTQAVKLWESARQLYEQINPLKEIRDIFPD